MKKLVYTANIGGYDTNHLSLQQGWHTANFTTLHKNYVWDDEIFGLEDAKKARYLKIITPHFHDYAVSVWVDASIEINCDLTKFADKYLTDDVDMVLMEHGRDCIYEEAKECIKRKKDSERRIIQQIQWLEKQNYPKHNGMVGTGILIRRHTNKVRNLMLRWWMVVKYMSRRDQLAFNYALWKYPKVNIAKMPYSVFEKEFTLNHHK